jgi:hypothetical protein
MISITGKYNAPVMTFLVMSFFFSSGAIWELRKDNIDLKNRIDRLEKN